MITPARQVRADMEQTDAYKSEVSQAVQMVMACIERAKSSGLTHTVFSVRPSYQQEVRRMFADNGYTFRPTGYLGGVWQLSEDICW